MELQRSANVPSEVSNDVSAKQSEKGYSISHAEVHKTVVYHANASMRIYSGTI